MIFALLGSAVAMQAPVPPREIRKDVVRVVSDFAGCMAEPIDSTVEWMPDGAGYRWGDRWIPRDVVEKARAAVLASNRDPHDLLAQLGITPESVEPHIGPLLEKLQTYAEAEKWDPKIRPPGMDELVRFENLAQLVEDYVHRRDVSTTHRGVEITLPGEPPIKITYDGSGMGWLVPWEVDTGARIWKSSDIRISKAVLPLVPEETPNHWFLDGTSYWEEWFWKDSIDLDWRLWDRRAAACWASRYREIRGFDAIPDWYRVESVRAGVRACEESVLADLIVSTRGPIDRARWWNPVEDDKPTCTWNDFIALLDDAVEVVGRNPWIESWRRSGPDRHVRWMAVGRGGSESIDRAAPEVQIAWADSGLRGRASVEVRLERGEAVAAIVYLSHADAGSIVTDARPGAAEHWLDALDVSFHPRAPTYVCVDASGGWNVRTGIPAPQETRNRGCRPR
jgi:hypothetical protein